MNNLDDKIKNSKNVIEESNINNANEIYETVKNKNKKHFNKEKINNFLNSINKKQLLKYSFITLLLITITIASMAILSISTPKVIVKEKNKFTSGLTQKLSNKVQNAKSIGELKAIISQARENEMKLVLLWFGSWKNGVSGYAPYWVMTNTDKFLRMQNKDGKFIPV